MSKVRERFSQQLHDFETIVFEKIKEHGRDVFVKEMLQGICEVLPKTRGAGAREDTRFTAHRIIHKMILRLSQDDEAHNYTQSAGLYAASNTGTFFYRDYLEELVKSGSARGAMNFLDKLYNACRMNAGVDFFPFEAFLLQGGLTETVDAQWPDDMASTMSVDSDLTSVRSFTISESPSDEKEIIEDCIVVLGAEEQYSSVIQNSSSSSNKILHEQISTLHDREEQYKQSFTECIKENQGWRTMLDELKLYCINVVQNLANRKKTLKEEKMILEGRIRHLENVNGALQRETEDLSRNNSTLQSQIAVSENRGDLLGGDITRQKKLNRRLTRHNSRLKRHIDELEAQEKANRQLLDEVEEERIGHEQRRLWLAVVNQLNRALRKENSRLKVKLEKLPGRATK